MVCEKFHIERAPDRNGNRRDAIVFELRSLEAVKEVVENQRPSSDRNLSELLKRALEAAQAPKQPSQAKRNLYERSKDVRDYVLLRAKGKCEGCEHPAPFMRKDGSPYLEPHHLRRVSDGGPDHPAFVISLCPNCHRHVHAGAGGKQLNVEFSEKMKVIEKYLFDKKLVP